MSKCIKCAREAEFDSPEDYCQFHWLEWWHEGAGPTFFDNEERLQRENLLMKLIKHDDPEDHLLMETLIEQYWKWMEEDED